MALPQQDSKYAIHEACREGKTSTVESLLNASPKLASLRDEDDRLPLHWAVSYNQLPIVHLLISASARDFDPDARDGLGWTPLMMAASSSSSSRRKDNVASGDDDDAMLDLLLARGADPKATNDAGQTALHFSASRANVDAARKLLAQGASARVKDRRGQLPLHRAASVGSVPLLRLLLDSKSPLNATDGDGMTALHHALAEGFGDAAVALLKAGAESGKRNADGLLAIEMAPDGKVRDYVLQQAELEGVEVEVPGGR